MDHYEYKGQKFTIVLDHIGKRVDWYFLDELGHQHKNYDELAPNESIALSEAKDKIHRLVDAT